VPVGRVTTFSIDRQGKAMQLKVTIAERHDDKIAAEMHSSGTNLGASSANAMGLSLSSLTPEARRAYNLNDDVSGVVITKVDPNSDAADKGLQPGDVVVKIGSHTVHSPADVQSGVADAQKIGRKSVLMLVARQAGGTVFVAVDIGQT
jgi:serine protease Do